MRTNVIDCPAQEIESISGRDIPEQARRKTQGVRKIKDLKVLKRNPSSSRRTERYPRAPDLGGKKFLQQRHIANQFRTLRHSSQNCKANISDAYNAQG